MSNYSQITNFTSKDSLPSGNPAKVIMGGEFDGEFNAISTAIATKADNTTVTSLTATVAGKVGGPASATDNAIVRFDGTTGKLVQNSNVVVDDNGHLLTTSSTGGLGYGTGAGGTVTQGSSSGKATTVTLNRPTGQITMNDAALGSNGVATFLFVNSLITITDTLLVQLNQAIGSTYMNYTLGASTGAGNAVITLRNISAGTLSEELVINFAIIKGATS